MYYRYLSVENDYRNKINLFRARPLYLNVLSVIGIGLFVLIGVAVVIQAVLSGRFGLESIIGVLLIFLAYRFARKLLYQPFRLFPDRLRATRLFARDAVVKFSEVDRFDVRQKVRQHRDTEGRRLTENTIAEILVPVYRVGGETWLQQFTLPQPSGGNEAFLAALAEDSGCRLVRSKAVLQLKWWEKLLG